MCGCCTGRAKFQTFGRKGLLLTQASFSQNTVNGTQIVRFFSSLKISHFFVCPFFPCFPSVCVELATHTVQFFLSPLDLLNTLCLSYPYQFFCPANDVSCVFRTTIPYCMASPPQAVFRDQLLFRSRNRDISKSRPSRMLQGCELLFRLRGADFCCCPLSLPECMLHPIGTEALALRNQECQPIGHFVAKKLRMTWGPLHVDFFFETDLSSHCL